MGGNYPMPTILSKGELILRLDRQYENAQRRLDGLRRLVVQDLDIVMSGQSGETPSGAKLVDAGEAKHMNDDWFGADGSNWWNVLQPLGFFPDLWVNGTLTNDQLLQARQTLKLGFIRALAVSLGLTESVLDAPGDIPETTGGLEADKIRPLKADWICGKLDGIEAQVVETKHQVVFFHHHSTYQVRRGRALLYVQRGRGQPPQQGGRKHGARPVGHCSWGTDCPPCRT